MIFLCIYDNGNITCRNQSFGKDYLIQNRILAIPEISRLIMEHLLFLCFKKGWSDLKIEQLVFTKEGLNDLMS